MAGTVYTGEEEGGGGWSADCYAGLGSFGVSGSVAAARHLSYAHRLKIVDNRKKNRTNCSNKQQTETTTTKRTTRGSWQLLFGLWWENNNSGLEAETQRGSVEAAIPTGFWRRVHTKFERVIQHAIIKLLKDNTHKNNSNNNNHSNTNRLQALQRQRNCHPRGEDEKKNRL